MKKRRGLFNKLFLSACLFLCLISSLSASIVVSNTKTTFVAKENTLYAFNSTGDFLFRYIDESTISLMVLGDKNRDGVEDVYVYSPSSVMPRLKIINGKNGAILDSIYLIGDSFIGNSFLEVENMVLVGTALFFSYGSMLHKVESGKVKFVGVFEPQIINLQGKDGGVEISCYEYGLEIIYLINLDGSIRSKRQQSKHISSWYSPSRGCDPDLFEGGETRKGETIAGVTISNSNSFFCEGNYLYYLNESSLMKKGISSSFSSSLYNVSCSLGDINIFGETVLCGNKVYLKGGKEITLFSSNEDALYYLAGQTEFVINRNWPFEFEYGDTTGEFNYGVLNESLLLDFIPNIDLDEDGNREIILLFFEGGRSSSSNLIYFGNEDYPFAMLIYELATGEKNLITLKKTESQFNSEKTNLEEQINDTQKQIDDLHGDISKQYTKLENVSLTEEERNSIQEEINNLEKQESDLYSQRDDFSYLFHNLAPIEYINSFDVCEEKLFFTTVNSNLYSFSKGKNITSLNSNRHSEYVMCAEDSSSNWKKGLLLFDSGGVSIADFDGTILEDEVYSFTNESLLLIPGILSGTFSEEIYLPINKENNYLLKVFNKKGDFLREELLNDREDFKTIGGRLFFCSERSDKFFLSFFGEERVQIEQDFDSYGFCDSVFIGDCDQDGKEEPVILFGNGDRLFINCLNKDSQITFNTNLGESSSHDFFFQGRFFGDYVITSPSVDSLSKMNANQGYSSLLEPIFPFEVYNLQGEKLFINNEALKIKGGKILDLGGNEINIKQDLISQMEKEEDYFNIVFSKEGVKTIFVDGQFYDVTDANKYPLFLTKGDHFVSAYSYDGEYSTGKESVFIPSPVKFSFLSLFLLFTLGILIFLFVPRRNR
jgi:hypothetical protein